MHCPHMRCVLIALVDRSACFLFMVNRQGVQQQTLGDAVRHGAIQSACVVR